MANTAFGAVATSTKVRVCGRQRWVFENRTIRSTIGDQDGSASRSSPLGDSWCCDALRPWRVPAIGLCACACGLSQRYTHVVLQPGRGVRPLATTAEAQRAARCTVLTACAMAYSNLREPYTRKKELSKFSLLYRMILSVSWLITLPPASSTMIWLAAVSHSMVGASRG